MKVSELQTENLEREARSEERELQTRGVMLRKRDVAKTRNRKPQTTASQTGSGDPVRRCKRGLEKSRKLKWGEGHLQRGP
jgi:hypothetical protein